MSADKSARLRGLPPRTRQLVEAVVRRPELSIVESAHLIGMRVHNARARLKEAYRLLDVEGRAHLVAEYRDTVLDHVVHESES